VAAWWQWEEEVEAYNPLSSAKAKKEKAQGLQLPDEELEGFSDDPTLTKVVDRRWFEKNKHIYPPSLWESSIRPRITARG
jgi:protein FAM50